MSVRTFTLYLRQHCHLCEQMVTALRPWCEAHGLTLDLVDVDGDPVLAARFGEHVPVLCEADDELCRYVLDEAALSRRLGIEDQDGSLREAGTYERIYALARRVPAGKVATYGQLATMEGRATARMVGYAMAALNDGSDVPWQRIINSRGEVSERSGGGGTGRQRERLAQEGVFFDASGRVDFERAGWDGPEPAWLARHGFTTAPRPGRRAGAGGRQRRLL